MERGKNQTETIKHGEKEVSLGTVFLFKFENSNSERGLVYRGHLRRRGGKVTHRILTEGNFFGKTKNGVYIGNQGGEET